MDVQDIIIAIEAGQLSDDEFAQLPKSVRDAVEAQM